MQEQRVNRRFAQRGLALGLLTLAGALAACSAAAPAAPQRTSTPMVVVLAGSPAPPVTATSAQPTVAPSPTAAASAPPTVVSATASPASAVIRVPTRTPAPPARPTPMTLATRQQIFAEVWTTVNDNYLYADFRGVDWTAVRDEFAPRIAATTGNEAFYQLLAEMVGRLDDNHSRFLPPSAAQREDVLSSGREAQVGIGVMTLPLADGLLIQQIFPNSPAERAGLRPRDRIVAIDGVSFRQGDMEGPAGSRVRLTVARPGASSRDLVIIRQPVEGRIRPVARRLANDIGYLSVSTLWVHDMAEQAAEALAAINTPRPLKGLILDLRSNPGGWRSVLTGLLGHFVRGPVGSFFSRADEAPLVIPAGAAPDLRGLPLVVLIDRDTASYAELLAGILQQEAQATVIGQPSAGNTETIYSYELTGSTRLWVAQEGFKLRDETNLEGMGVQPDVPISLDWTRFSETDDPGIVEGMRLLIWSAGGK